MYTAENCRHRLGRMAFYASLQMAMLASVGIAAADSSPLTPQTKIRLTVVQWMPLKGQYEPWQALSGEYTVTRDGELALPVLGQTPVGSLDAAGLANEIEDRLQSELGLIDKPSAVIEVVEYPPIYVVGDVTRPGEYRYHPLMTVLQAVALAGGEMRSGDGQTRDQIKLVGDLRSLDVDRIRTKVRLARLAAELSGASDFQMRPSDVDAADASVSQIITQEQVVFATRAKELARQNQSLNELRALLETEIGVLQKKIEAADSNIASAERELVNITALVAKGITVASRQTDLERALGGYRTDRLDQLTSVMRARQAISEATRNQDGLVDRRRTEIASEFQTEQANDSQIALKIEVGQKLLVYNLSRSTDQAGETPTVAIAVVRQGEEAARSAPADYATPLVPGDVVQLTFSRPTARSLPVAGLPTVGRDAIPQGLSQ
jgi:protein involved in polysaccharide export with SLBB domain